MLGAVTATTQEKASTHRRETYRPRNVRRILCVFPRYTRSFGTMHHAYPLMRGVKAFMPPQGLLVIAAYLPKEWEVRFIDENKTEARESDYHWADAVFISGMHVQRQFIVKINAQAHAQGKITILGGPSVSSSPEWYRDIDILHCGELGDATDKIVRRLDESVARPETQEIHITSNRLPLNDFPVPEYRQIKLTDYFLASVQFSSGCPYKCEFCDIPELYGRNPRLKTPQQVSAELDAMLARGNPGAVYFVDDNFIANQKAALELLEHLGAWQRERGYPVQFACEATLNLAQNPRIMELMREAYFCTVFCGIETPEDDALEAIQKTQNMREPLLESIKKLNAHGIEVVSGIIMGLDTDTPVTGERVSAFIEASNIPMLTINMLHALPKTPLWRRLEKDKRIVNIPGRESNVEFLLPYETVSNMWLESVRKAYTPDAIYARFDHQIRNTYPNRKQLPATKARVNPSNILRGLSIMGHIVWHVGLRSDYRKRFWKTAWPNLKKGKIEEVIHSAVVSHHMILFARDCLDGTAEKCFYSETPKAAETAPKAAHAATRPAPSPAPEAVASGE
ncbi:MAG: B12-binding domain-containing radical SAM protein [Planctomycetes bacterium]|nr:B12-binding domain-containing radical SAM protein [Planctomycetota bacterium]